MATIRNAAMAEVAMADDTDITPGDTPIGLGANVPNAPITETPASEDTIDQLDQLLKEFEAGLSQPTDQQVDQSPDAGRIARDLAFARNLDIASEAAQIDSKRRELQQQQEFLRAQEDAHDEAEALRAIRGDLDVGDEDVQGFIAGRVLKDPDISHVWQNRREDRASYNRMVARLRDDLQQHEEQQRQKVLSREALVDREAVAQAVRGQGGKVPPEPPPDYGRMSNREFQKYTQDNWGF
jgi:hypothetical protein